MFSVWGAFRVMVMFGAGMLASCAAKQEWVKPGAGQNEFTQARYSCLQQSQQSFGAAYVNRYGGSASSGMTTNGGLFDACMNSQGWILQGARTPEQAAADKARGDQLMSEQHAAQRVGRADAMITISIDF